ncbi:autotransporter outer membrane beta-barrel domain-containing protein [Entomomonas moraniae]|uniref:Autotransporter outer membrane beta-barrel domain-containing protein n=1 Tax=Entomomonas moraniae TaxID=2213226 RepID=A0A3Q9JKF9_9GAMM|nr:autotransporter outer membrane beta-barrel domain-containing protein [Entomomonas moraniae]AZS51599.1 autotransporter outer membrane beta-barrel domain-containing protein [Entomomonas moraniae]
MFSKILIGFLGITPIFSYGMTCTENTTSYTCSSNKNPETVDLNNLDKGYYIPATNNTVTVNLNDSNITLNNYNNSVVNVWAGNNNGTQTLNATGNNIINLSGDKAGKGIIFQSNGNGHYNLHDNLNITIDTPNGTGADAIHLYTTNTWVNFDATGSIKTNGGTGIDITGGGIVDTNINSASLDITTNANNVTNNLHHGISVINYGNAANVKLGNSGYNQIDVDVQSGLGSALAITSGGNNGQATIGSYNNSATGSVKLSGGYGDSSVYNSAGLYFSTNNNANASYTVNIGNNVTIDSGNDTAIKVDTGNQVTINNQGQITGYVTSTGKAQLVLNNEAGSLWNMRNFGADGTTKNTITNEFSGGTFSNAGTIKFADENFDGTATNAIFNVATLNNSGIIDLTGKNSTGANNLVGDTFTINGNYVSDGGSIYLNTLLDDASSNGGQGTSDLIIVNGNVTTSSGATNLYITPTASTANLGQLTTGNGIKVVEVQGTSSSDAFQLGRPVVAGAYEYTLGQGQSDDSWYLSSYYKGNAGGNGIIQYNPAIGAYLANQTAAVQMFQQTLFDRLISSSDGKNNDASKSLFWMRTKMTHGSYDSVHGQLNNRNRSYSLQMGGDLNVWALDNGGYFHLGMMAGYGDAKNTNKSDSTGTKTDGKVKGYTTGVYGTYFANQDTNLGLYVDLWSQMGWYRNEISGEAQQGTKKYNSTVWSNSVELGYGIPLTESGDYQWLATPQAQFTYNHYDADNQHDKNNLSITNNNASGLDTRLGVRFHARGIQKDLIEPFIEVNWLDTTAKNELDFNGKSYKDGFAKDRLEAKIGLQGNINKQWSVSAQMGGQWGNNSFSNYQGQLNVNYKF